MSQSMTPEEEQCRDVYAHFGLAVFFAQNFEKSLCNYILFQTGLTNGNITLETVDAIEKAIHKKTLGQLLKETKLIATFDDPADESLVNEALIKRNYLFHDYFWDRAVEFMSPNGREVMLGELPEFRLLFQRADTLAKAMARAAGKMLGISDDLTHAEISKMMQEAKSM